jgi:uncharacterized phage infection (PIP) family protein YhgE
VVTPECVAAAGQFSTALQAVGTSIPQIQDPNVKAAATTSFQQAQEGLTVFTQSVQTGTPFPAPARDQLVNGLTSLGNTLIAANA